jgi:hypothetical protein
MDLKEIASISGKGGLFKVIKPTRNGVILESIDALKHKLIANSNTRVSLLKEISVYTSGKESSILLEEVYKRIFSKYGKQLPIDNKASERELSSFLEEILPEYDKEKVYNSDIKKLVGWYTLLSNYNPEVFEEKSSESAVEQKELEPVSASDEEAKPKAKKAKKA